MFLTLRMRLSTVTILEKIGQSFLDFVENFKNLSILLYLPGKVFSLCIEEKTKVLEMYLYLWIRKWRPVKVKVLLSQTGRAQFIPSSAWVGTAPAAIIWPSVSSSVLIGRQCSVLRADPLVQCATYTNVRAIPVLGVVYMGISRWSLRALSEQL